MYFISASSNHLEAQYLIGVDYLEGNGLLQDYAKALEWFHISASEDYALAQDVIGCMYSYGFGVEQDYNKAFEWCLKAANQGYDKAQSNVAYLYKEGLGVERDDTKALVWYTKAAEQGDTEAQKNLELLNNINIVEEIKKPFSFRDPFSTITSYQDETHDTSETLDIIGIDTKPLIPFSSFFKDYFCDESGSYPENSGGGVWFVENMTFNERDKFSVKINKVHLKYENNIDLRDASLIIDTTITKNFGAGVFVTTGGDYTKLDLKYLSSEWKTIRELKKAYYCDSDHNLYINGFEISMVSENARFYGARLAECINAYLQQSDNKKIEEKVASNSEVVTNSLDNIDGRLADIKEKLAFLQNDVAA